MTLSSRNPDSCAFGKCDERIDVPVPGELKEKIAAMAVLQGFSGSAEWVRDLLLRKVYGEFEVMQRTVAPGRARRDGMNIG